jgi:hypothetical protein
MGFGNGASSQTSTAGGTSRRGINATPRPADTAAMRPTEAKAIKTIL